MKLTSKERASFVSELQRQMLERSWNISEAARKIGIDQSQLSRILAGNFKTRSSNIMQICMKLEIDPATFRAQTNATEDRALIANTALLIWDGTHADSQIVVSLLREIAKLRKHPTRD